MSSKEAVQKWLNAKDNTIKAGANCSNLIGCHYIDEGYDEKGVCYPEMTDELKNWFQKKENGKIVGRAPDWPCPFYTKDFFNH